MNNIIIKQHLNTLSPTQKTLVYDFIESLSHSKKTNTKKTPKAGFLKGTFKTKPDFDDTLKEFKNYV